MRTRYEIPQGFTDEIRYFRFVPLRSLLVLLLTAIPGLVLVKIMSYFDLVLPTVIVWIFVETVIVGSTMIPKPRERWRDGGGVTFDRLFLRKLIRRHTRCLYIRGSGQKDGEET